MGILMGIFIGGVLASLTIMMRTIWRSFGPDGPRAVETVKIGVIGALPYLCFGLVGWYLYVLLWSGF